MVKDDLWFVQNRATLRTCRRAGRVLENALYFNQTKLKHETSNCIYEERCECFPGYLPLIKKETAAKRGGGGGGGGGTRVIVLLGATGASKMCTFSPFLSEITHREVKTKECV